MTPRRTQPYNRSQWESERERFHIKDYYPPSRSNLQSVADIVPKILKKLGLEQRSWENQLLEQWESLAGKNLSKHTRPGRLQNRVLHVFVSNSTWLSELSRYGKKDLLAKLQKQFGAARIRDIRLQLDPDMNAPR